MRVLNVAGGWVVGAMVRPMEAWPPALSLALVSAVAAVLLLAIVKVASDQTAVVALRRQIQAGLLELRLFQDEPRLFLRAAADLLGLHGRYLRTAMVPMLWAAVPFALLVSHLEVYYGRTALAPGGTAIVTVRLRPGLQSGGSGARPPISLGVPAGIALETPAVWAPSLHEIAWRIGVRHPGGGPLRVTWQARDELTKQLAVSDRLVACDAVRPAPGFRNEWRYPSEPRLPADAPIEAIEVVYPSRSIRLAGLDLPWAVVFLGFTVLFALCGRPLFGVTF